MPAYVILAQNSVESGCVREVKLIDTQHKEPVNLQSGKHATASLSTGHVRGSLPKSGRVTQNRVQHVSEENCKKKYI